MSQTPPPNAAEPVERLRRFALGIAGPEDLAWWQTRAAALVSANGTLTADEALSLATTRGQKSPFRAASLERRDECFRGLATQCFPRKSKAASAKAIDESLTMYAASRWRTDRSLPAPPLEYQGTAHAFLFEVMLLSPKGAPGERHIRRILAKQSSF